MSAKLNAEELKRLQGAHKKKNEIDGEIKQIFLQEQLISARKSELFEENSLVMNELHTVNKELEEKYGVIEAIDINYGKIKLKSN